MGCAVELRDVTHAYGAQPALTNLDLVVQQGSRHGLIGSNGAGKTTTMRILATLLVPQRGRVRVLGHDVVAAPQTVRGVVGYVGDEGLSCYPGWSVREYVEAFGRLHGLTAPASAARRALDAVGWVPARAERAVGRLSTGERRRVELARALVGQPRLLLLDEPTRGLDMAARREVWALLRRVHGRGVTMVVSSHDAVEVQALCDEVTVLRRGRVALCSRVADLPDDAGELEDLLSDVMTKREGSNRAHA